MVLVTCAPLPPWKSPNTLPPPPPIATTVIEVTPVGTAHVVAPTVVYELIEQGEPTAPTVGAVAVVTVTAPAHATNAPAQSRICTLEESK
jgi:hypothetical protein